MKRLLLAVLVGLTGCGGTGAGNADDFRNASPSRQGINIAVPANGQALTSDDVGQSQQKLLGQTASLYQATRGMTVGVNAGVLWVATLCESIVHFDPTTIDDTRAVWGPWTDQLSPNTYRFTVTKSGDSYDYVLEGKAKTDPDTAFLTLISGNHKPGAAKKQGEGSFTVNWNNSKLLPEHGTDVGSADFTYSRNASLDVTVGVAFHQVWDSPSASLVDANYAFSQIANGDGSFEFVVYKDMTDLPNNTPALERQAIKSRWTKDGAGRADVKLSQGDLTTPVTVSECWGATFLETYYQDSLGITATQGQQSDCVFASPEYTTL